MCENNKNYGGSEAKSSALSPILAQVPKGASKIFILTPEILQSLGIAGRVGIKKVTGEAANIVTGGPTAAGVSSKFASQGHATVDPRLPKERSGEASKGKKRKRSSAAEKTVEKKEENKNSTEDSLELKHRLSAREGEPSGSEKCFKEDFCSSKTTKMKQKVYAPKVANDRGAVTREEGAWKDAKGETESAAIIGVRISRRTPKPKKFDDYVTTDDVVDETTETDVLDFPSAAPKRHSRKSHPSAKKTVPAAQSRRSVAETAESCEETTSSGGKTTSAAGLEREESMKSGESAKANAKRCPTSNTREISSVLDSCSAVIETSDDSNTLKRSEIVRTYARSSKATKRNVVESRTTEIECSKNENSKTNTNSSSLGIRLASDSSEVEPVKRGILKTYSSRKVKKKMTPASTEQTNESETKETDEPEASKPTRIPVQASVVSQPECDSGQPEIMNNCEKPKTNDISQRSDKEKAVTESEKLKTTKFTSRPKIRCIEPSPSAGYENSAAIQSSINSPSDNVEQSSGIKSKLEITREAKEIRASETDPLKRSRAREDDIPKALLEESRSSEILESSGKRVVSAKPIRSSDERDASVSKQDTPISREDDDRSSIFKPEENSPSGTDLLQEANTKIMKQAESKSPSEMKFLTSAKDEHEVITLKATATSKDQSRDSALDLDALRSGHHDDVVNPRLDTAESTSGNETSTSKLEISKSRDESEAILSKLETPCPEDKNKIVVSSLVLSSVPEGEAEESADTNGARTEADTPSNIDSINVVTAKPCTPSSGRGKRLQLAKIATPRSSKKNKSKSLLDVPSSPAKSDDVPKADDGPEDCKGNEAIDSKLRGSGFADQSGTASLELRVSTPARGRRKRPSGWTTKGDIGLSMAGTPKSPDENAVESECNVPASCVTNETIVSQPDISSSSDHNEPDSKHDITKSSPREKASSGSMAQFPEENKAVDTKLEIPNCPNEEETSKNDTPKSPTNKTYSIPKALAKVSNKGDVGEAKLGIPNFPMKKETSKRAVPKSSGREQKRLSKAQSSDKNEAAKAKPDQPNYPNEEETSERDTSKSTGKEVIGILPKAFVPNADKSKAIDTELEIPNSTDKKEVVFEESPSNAPLPQDEKTFDSTEKASCLSKVTTSTADPSTDNPPSRDVATIVSTNFSAAGVDTESAKQSRTIVEAPPGEDDPVGTPEVSVPRKKGRPRQSQNAVNADASMTTAHTAMENANAVDAASVEVAAENSGRTKKPVPRNADETDGKGLSEDDSDLDWTTEEIVPARRPGRPPGSISRSKCRGRRRGRGRGRVDREYVPRERASCDRKPDTEKSDAVNAQSNSEKPNAEIPPVPEVECGKCKKTMPEKSWPHHNLMTHNNMGWLSDQPEPDFKNDEKLLRSVLAAVIKKKRRKVCFVCEECGDSKRSANGFISHLQVCGKTDDERQALLVTCPICGNRMMSSTVPIHERFHRQMENTKKKLTKLLVASTDSGRERRKAAEKAATKIIEFTDLIKEDEEPTNKRRRTNGDSENLVEKSRDTSPPTRWRGLWKIELNEKGKAMCRHPGCNFLGDTMESMFKHHSDCSCAPRVNYLCKICNFSHEAEEEVVKHVRSEHSSEPSKTLKEDSDFEYKDDCSSSSKYDCQESSDDKPRRSSATQQKLAIEREQRSGPNVKFLSAECPLYPKAYYLPAVRWTMEFESKNYRLRLFEKLSPNAMRLLSADEARGYLPKLDTSMRIMDTNKETNEGATGAREKSSEWITWQRFEGRISDGIPTLFTGGPVWAVAWLTIPALMYAREVDQYIAVSTHPTMESVYSVGKSHPGKNLIQIWNLGHLDNRKKDVPATPRFAYGIAHDKGTIWCLEWCPSGCYEHSSFLNEQKTDEQAKSPRRMGLLAAACSDGCVHVFSLPFIDEDSSTSADESSSNDPPIYETRPLLTLLISTAMYEKAEQTWQCTKLNWSRELGHDTIIAGFSNGYIAMWDLTSESPLFVTKRNDTTLVEAFHHFYAHGHAVSFVQLIPYGDKRFFVSSSYDRSTKVWDLEDTSCPLSTTKRGVAMDGAWLTHWPGYLTAYDDATVPGSSTYLMLFRQAAVKAVALLPAKSATFCVGVSDYGNSIAHGTLAGEIVAIFPQHLWNHRDMERDIPMKRALASTVEVVDLTMGKAARKENKKMKANAKNSRKDYTYMPETYEQCRNRFGIVFRRSLNRTKGELSKRTRPLCSERLADVNVEQYPFTSVNRVSWNPNAWSYLWLCVGYQNGLVRFLHFNAAKLEKESSRLLPTHAASMLDESGRTNERKNEATF